MLGCVSGFGHLTVVQAMTRCQAPWVQGTELTSGSCGWWMVGVRIYSELVVARCSCWVVSEATMERCLSLGWPGRPGRRWWGDSLRGRAAEGL